MARDNALFLLSDSSFDLIYGPDERAEIAELVNLIAPQQSAESIAVAPELLGDVDVIFSGWGMPPLDDAFLASAPNLRAVFYSAGSIRGFATGAAWDRGIVISSAWGANAVPVVEYTLSQILFGLKCGWHQALTIKDEGHWVKKSRVPGAYGSTVGIISLGMIGRMVVERLKTFDVNVIAYDPYVDAETAAELGVKLSSLEDLFAHADVVSLHTPKLTETLGMITGAHIASMRDSATFINTSRGAVVNEPEMIAALQDRPDLYAVLDVTDPEPPVEGSSLYTLPNVILTPHIAGSMSNECRRMARYMIDEYRHFRDGLPLRWQITRDRARTLA